MSGAGSPPQASVHTHNGPKRRRARRGVRWDTDLRIWRRRAGLKQVEAAPIFGLSRSHLSLMECGLLLPTFEEAEEIVSILENCLHRALLLGRVWSDGALDAMLDYDKEGGAP